MALGLAQQWTLVACSVMAHADGVVDGEECDRLMSLIEDRVDGDEYSAWLATISDPKRLDELLGTLETPDPSEHREILEQAWSLAIVDGERTDSEVATLERIADHLGVPSVQLQFWRDAWTAGQDAFAEAIAKTVACVLGGGAPVFEEDRKLIRELVWRLPTSNEHREKLASVGIAPQVSDELERTLSTMPRGKRNWLLRLVAPTMRAASRPEESRRRFVELGVAVGLPEDRLVSMLDDA